MAVQFAMEEVQVGTEVCHLFVEHVEQRSRGVPVGRAAAVGEVFWSLLFFFRVFHSSTFLLRLCGLLFLGTSFALFFWEVRGRLLTSSCVITSVSGGGVPEEKMNEPGDTGGEGAMSVMVAAAAAAATITDLSLIHI